jgi:hypothetical protein
MERKVFFASIGMVGTLLAVLGFFVGRSRGEVGFSVNAQSSRVKTTDVQNQLSPRRVVEPRNKPTVVDAAYLKKLDGKEFLRLMPWLESLARDGNMAVVRALFERLHACVGFQNESEEDIRHHADEHRRARIDWAKKNQADYPNDTAATQLVASENAEYESRLKDALDTHAFCSGLTPQQIGKRLDWFKLAMERQDRAMLLLMTYGEVETTGIERVRYAEKLNEIADLVRINFDDTIATGDLTVLERAAYAYSSPSTTILQHDSELAYSYAYARFLVGGAEVEQQQISALMDGLAKGNMNYPPLSAEQIDAARDKGSALFKQCCQCCARGSH